MTVRDGMQYYVYILANKIGGTLYTGVTNDLVRRIYEHREGIVEGFTKNYGVNCLVYFRSTFQHRGCNSSGETDQEVEQSMESKADRGEEPELG
jgi:predicted GIY-YIG superfamily endonuclease